MLRLLILGLLLLRLLLLAPDLLKRLLHVRIEARAVAEVGIENMFHAISCLGAEIVSKPALSHCEPAVVLADYRAWITEYPRNTAESLGRVSGRAKPLCSLIFSA